MRWLLIASHRQDSSRNCDVLTLDSVDGIRNGLSTKVSGKNWPAIYRYPESAAENINIGATSCRKTRSPIVRSASTTVAISGNASDESAIISPIKNIFEFEPRIGQRYSDKLLIIFAGAANIPRQEF
jgi:hypothetical protein